METKRYQIFPNDDKTCTVADFTISAPMQSMAERDIVIMDANGKAVAVIEVQPHFDTRTDVPL